MFPSRSLPSAAVPLICRLPLWLAAATLLAAITYFAPGPAATTGTAHAHAEGLACEVTGMALPRTVYIDPGVDVSVVTAAMAEWNAMRPGTFVRINSSEGADVRVIPSHATWVEMPCKTLKSVVHVGNDVNLNYWMAHELGHTLGLRDHIKQGTDASRYINPAFCPASGYEGVMSYCAARSAWWGADDRAMMAEAFPAEAIVAPSPTATPTQAPAPADLNHRGIVPSVTKR